VFNNVGSTGRVCSAECVHFIQLCFLAVLIVIDGKVICYDVLDRACKEVIVTFKVQSLICLN
jgi:hypothetical protein